MATETQIGTPDFLGTNDMIVSAESQAEIAAISEEMRIADRYPVVLFQGILRYGEDNGHHWDQKIAVRCGELTAQSLTTTGVQRADPNREGFAVQLSNGETSQYHEATAVYVRTNKGDTSTSRLGQKWLLQSSNLSIIWYGDTPQGHSRFELSLPPLNSSPEVFHKGTLIQHATSHGAGKPISSGNLRHCTRLSIGDQLKTVQEKRVFDALTARVHADTYNKAAALAVGESVSTHTL